MAEQKYVPAEHFVTSIKILCSQVIDLTANVMALRAALMQQASLPIPPEELKRLHEFFRNYEPIRKAREAVETAGTNTPEDMLEFLKRFEGPIQ